MRDVCEVKFFYVRQRWQKTSVIAQLIIIEKHEKRYRLNPFENGGAPTECSQNKICKMPALFVMLRNIITPHAYVNVLDIVLWPTLIFCNPYLKARVSKIVQKDFHFFVV